MQHPVFGELLGGKHEYHEWYQQHSATDAEHSGKQADKQSQQQITDPPIQRMFLEK